MYYLGIDLGGTNIVAGVVDENYKIIAKESCKTNVPRPEEEICDDMALVAKKALAAAKLTNDDISFVGIGVPGAVNGETGMIEYAANLGFHNWPIVKMMEERLGTKVKIENDANAAALGEKIYGGGRNLDHFIVITLGTGLGSGIIIDGKLLLGADGFAGELGHVCAVVNGRVCGCGKRGCLETYASATGIKRTYLEMVAKYNGQSTAANVPWSELDAKVIEDAARAGDIAAAETYQITGNILGRCLADFIHFSRPSSIFLFGGPVKSGDLLLVPTRESMEKNLMPVFRNKVKLLPSELPASDAAILGASALVWSAL